ncbi:MAG TPA: hypothetical protein VF290_07545 [Pyrinomonadaceae bacterium]
MIAQNSVQIDTRARGVSRGKISGRAVVLFAMLACFFLLLFTTFAPQHYKLWRHLGVPSMSPSFADTRTLTVALESDLKRADIWAPNARDPWERAFNYPRVWLLLKTFGINQSHTNIIGLGLAVIFFVCLWRLARGLSLRQGLYFALLVFSPVTMFAVERGNIDLLMFGLLTAAIVLFQRKDQNGTVGAAVSIMLASILKLFPFLGVSLFLSLPKKKALLTIGACSALFGLYLLLTAGDLRLISQATPRPTFLGYGSDVLLAFILGGQALRLVSSTVLLAALFAVIWLRISKRGEVLDVGTETSFELNCFRVGAALYLGTFLLGNNWDYRLIFLLFTVPQLLSWYRTNKLVRAGALLSLICTALAFQFYFYSSENLLRFILVKQAINWVLAGGVFSLFLKSAPVWVQEWLWLRSRPERAYAPLTEASPQL